MDRLLGWRSIMKHKRLLIGLTILIALSIALEKSGADEEAKEVGYLESGINFIFINIKTTIAYESTN